jgi:hypothetical protein
MSVEEEIIDVAMEAGKRVLVHAQGSPAQIVSVGVAAGLTALAVVVGYGVYKGGSRIVDWMSK